jgi:hypothetical protein
MSILVFGQSNSLGSQLAPGELSWPKLLEAQLQDVVGAEVEVTVRPFYAHTAGAIEYLDQQLKRYPSDLVIMTTTPFAFLDPMVGPGVRRRYGERVGNVYQWFESRFYSSTRHASAAGHWLNRAGRRLSHAVLGASPITSYEIVLDGISAAFQRLAREEQAQLVILQGVVQLPAGSARATAARQVLLQRYLAETRAAAERFRLVYISLMKSRRAVLAGRRALPRERPPVRG